jgi:hypothetical protein
MGEGLYSDLQDLVDRLGATLRRSVVAEDTDLRPLAYTAFTGDEDSLRRRAILERRAPPEARARHMRARVAHADGPFRLPAEAELGMAARVETPIRYGATLLGYLSVLDPDCSLTEVELFLIADAAQTAATCLALEAAAHTGAAGASGQALRTLVTHPTAEPALADELTNQGLFGPDGTVLVVAVGAEPNKASLDQHLGLVERMSQLRVVARVPAQQLRALYIEPHTVIVQGAASAGRLRPETLLEELVNGSARLRAGVGHTMSLAQVSRSYAQATFALRLAERGVGCTDVLRFADLGSYRAFLSTPLDEITDDHFPPELLSLLREPRSCELVATLEAYLELGCDAARTADELSLHRTSVYNRLERIEALTGLDLRDGDTRLALHNGFRLAKLAGPRISGARAPS